MLAGRHLEFGVLSGADAEDVLAIHRHRVAIGRADVLLMRTTTTLAATEASGTSGNGPSLPEVVPQAASNAAVAANTSVFIILSPSW